MAAKLRDHFLFGHIVENVERGVCLVEVQVGTLHGEFSSLQVEFVDKVAASPVEALLYLEKMAKMIEANSLGGPSEIKVADAGIVDPFEAEFFPELAYANDGTID